MYWVSHFLRNKLNYLIFYLQFFNNILQIKFFSRKQISNLSFIGIMYTTFVAKSCFTDQSNFFHLFIFIYFTFPVIEVIKYFVEKSLKIMTTLAKMVAILSNYVSPGYRIFKEICHATLYNLMIWSQVNMLLRNSCKFGQALQEMFAIFFLIISPLIMAF